MIKWEKIMENEKRQFEKMSEVEKFVYFLLLQYGSPYSWGKENPEGSDCSGAVCMALYAATGLLIRTTADDLYRRVFTVKNPRRDMIRAAFFAERKTGKVTHTAGLLDDRVVLNSRKEGRGYGRWRKFRCGFGTRGAVRRSGDWIGPRWKGWPGKGRDMGWTRNGGGILDNEK